MANTNMSKNYSKWDHFDEEDCDTDGKFQAPTQFENSGDADIEFEETNYMTEKEIARIRVLNQTKSEIWQIVVRKLRVWSASSQELQPGQDESDLVPCRPYCILVNNLYPQGQVLTKKICDPPEVYPSKQEILKYTIQTMLNPPNSVPQHRPDKIVFPDKSFVGGLRKSYSSIGIECTYLTESEGIDEYIGEFSNHLVRNDIANIGDVSEKRGMLANSPGLTSEILHKFYSQSSELVKLQPWNHLIERQAIEIKNIKPVENPHTSRVLIHPNTSVYVSLYGSTAENGPTGLGVFFKKSDLERRLLPNQNDFDKLAYLKDPAFRYCNFCGKTTLELNEAKEDKPAEKVGSEIESAEIELKKCTRCKTTFYCDSKCQRSDWPMHKAVCVAKEKQDNDSSKKSFWAKKEMAVFFGGITSMTFDDLDAIDRYNFPICSDPALAKIHYPTAISFQSGKSDIPELIDILWLNIVLDALLYLFRSQPLYMNQSVAQLIDPLAKVPVLTTDEYSIRNATVLTIDDVERLRTLATKKEEEKKSLDNKQEQTQEDGPKKEAHVGEEDNDKSCCVM